MANKHNSGVYRIDIGENYYFGLSRDLRERISLHRSRLLGGKHHNSHMQSAYNKHRQFAVSVLVYCEGEYMQRLEAGLIKLHIDDKRCMNQVAEDPYGSRMYSEETRKKIGDAQRGKKQDPAVVAKRAAALRGRIFSEEHRRKLSERQRGRVVSEETRRKLSEANTGRKPTEEQLRRQSDATRGKVKPSLWQPLVLRNQDGHELYFHCLKRAAEFLGVNRGNLGAFLRGVSPWPTRPSSKLAGWTGHYIDKEAESGN